MFVMAYILTRLFTHEKNRFVDIFCSLCLFLVCTKQAFCFYRKCQSVGFGRLVGFCRRLCVEYDISAESLNDYYRRCGRDWGHVGLALEIARTSGRSMRDVCDHYRRYRSEGWSRILIELGIGPESSYRTPFYDRVHSHSDYWYEAL